MSQLRPAKYKQFVPEMVTTRIIGPEVSKFKTVNLYGRLIRRQAVLPPS